MLENTEGAIKNEQSRETGNTCHTRRRKTKQKHNTTQYKHSVSNSSFLLMEIPLTYALEGLSYR